MDDLPFKVEYAKSGRAGCKGCKMNIGKDVLRLARMVQSPFHDGKNPNWYHFECLFKKQRPVSDAEISGFETIRYEDQEKIKNKIKSTTEMVTIVPAKKGKKRGAAGDDGGASGIVKMTKEAARDFGIEYAKSGRAECRGCLIKILKDEIRIKKVDYTTEVGMKFGGQPLWHHVECFAKLRTELGWLSGGDQLPGFKSLKKDDAAKVLKELPPVKSDQLKDIKKPKLEVKDEPDSGPINELEQKIKSQNKEYFKNRDKLKDNLKKAQLISILVKNKQTVPEGEYLILDAVADMLTFGALQPCSICKGQFVFQKSNYICNGNIDEWTKCENIIKEPPRVPCRIPSALAEEYSFLKKKFKVMPRALKFTAPAIKKEEVTNLGPRTTYKKPPLYSLEFAVIGKTAKSQDELKVAIEKQGGKLSKKIHNKLAAIISTEKEVEKMSSKMKDAETYGVQIISEDFLDKVVTEKMSKEAVIEYIKEKSICIWGTDPLTRIPQEETKSTSQKSLYTKSVPKSVTLKLQNGTAVDPDSNLEHTTHVYVDGKVKYFAILSNTDIQRDKNSFYKIQLLENNSGKVYYIFRAWGRIGTTIGGNKTETFYNVCDAIDQFNHVYSEQTGNTFNSGRQFKKIPGRYYPIDIDYGDGEELEKKLSSASQIPCSLESSVQNLIKLLFDVEAMRKAMVEFDLDMEKMPLGKLSQAQLSKAMSVLKQISEYVKEGATNAQFIGASNQFFTLIPHDFGMERPPIINTTEMVIAKTEMLESLMEIEIAYGLIKESKESCDTVNPLDTNYKQLNTELKVVDKNSEEYQLLQKYVKNTHAATHSNFSLEIQDIFRVERQGEKRRYKPFKKLHNRQLLWHGSRLTNFVGILSHGLKIAPPEAPVTGYMFGKGIYFADMVSKSANYCCTSSLNSTGLMLLSEVALGDMMECHQAKYVTKLPNDKHSVKGCGKTFPNPIEAHVREDGVQIPLGKAITDNNMVGSLLYNEFIVYDIAQVNVQYLFRMKFNHSY